MTDEILSEAKDLKTKMEKVRFEMNTCEEALTEIDNNPDTIFIRVTPLSDYDIYGYEADFLFSTRFAKLKSELIQLEKEFKEL